jgi:peptide/nickel transport system substrate-binding protein
MKQIKWPALFLAAALTLATFTACSSNPPAASGAAASTAPSTQPQTSQTPSEPKNLTISFAAAWENVNPLVVSGDYKAYVQGLIFDKLGGLNNKKEITPRLLDSWTLSADGLTLTANINPNAQWHDGTPLTTDDVVFTFELLANPATPSGIRQRLLTGVTAGGVLAEGETLGIKAVDAQTIEFYFKAPTRELAFFSAVQYIFILPRHILEGEDPATLLEAPFFQAPVGSGPFVFESQTIGTDIQLATNKDFYLGAPDFDHLTIRVVPNENVYAGLLSGEIDLPAGTGLSALPYNDYVLAQQDAGLTTAAVPAYGSQFAIFNVSGDVFGDVNVRRAFEQAVNKQSLVDDLLRGEGTVAYTPIPSFSEYGNPNLAVNAYDPAKAKELLDAAGFDYNRTVKLLVPSGVTEREQAAVLIQQNLAAVGVNVDISLIDFAALMGILLGGAEDFDFALLGRASSVDPATFKSFYAPFTPGSGTTAGNFARSPDTSIYELFVKGETVLDPTQAKETYYQLQQLIQDQVPYIYLYNQNALLAYNSRITGIDFDGYFTADNIWDWKVA